eukprot:4305453-Prymnesium_polylepis.1
MAEFIHILGLEHASGHDGMGYATTKATRKSTTGEHADNALATWRGVRPARAAATSHDRRAELIAGGSGAAAAAGSGASGLFDGLQLHGCRGGSTERIDGRGSRQWLRQCSASPSARRADLHRHAGQLAGRVRAHCSLWSACTARPARGGMARRSLRASSPAVLQPVRAQWCAGRRRAVRAAGAAAALVRSTNFALSGGCSCRGDDRGEADRRPDAGCRLALMRDRAAGRGRRGQAAASRESAAYPHTLTHGTVKRS